MALNAIINLAEQLDVDAAVINPAECFSAFSAALCWPGVPMMVTKTSAIDSRGNT